LRNYENCRRDLRQLLVFLGDGIHSDIHQVFQGYLREVGLAGDLRPRLLGLWNRLCQHITEQERYAQNQDDTNLGR